MSWQRNLAALGAGALSGAREGAALGPVGATVFAVGGGLIAGLQLLAEAETQGRADQAAAIQQELLAKFGPLVDQAKAMLEQGQADALPKLQRLEQQAQFLLGDSSQRVGDAASVTDAQTTDLLGNISRARSIAQQRSLDVPEYYAQIQRSLEQQTNPANIYREAAQQAAINQTAGQEANLNRTLAQRGVTGPQSTAAHATLAAQRAKQMFGLDAEAAAMGADFEARRQDNIRGVIEAGGKAKDANVQAYLQALRDPQGLTVALTREQQAGAGQGQAFNQVQGAVLNQYGVAQQTGSGLGAIASQAINGASQAGGQASAAQQQVNNGMASVGPAIAETMRGPALTSLVNSVPNWYQAASQGVGNWTSATNASHEARLDNYRPAALPSATTPLMSTLANTPQAGNYQDNHLMPYRRNAQGSL